MHGTESGLNSVLSRINLDDISFKGDGHLWDETGVSILDELLGNNYSNPVYNFDGIKLLGFYFGYWNFGEA